MRPKYDKEFVEKCQRKALSVMWYAKKRYYFLQNCLEDIESWVFLQLIEGRSLKTRNTHILVDYMREHLGDSRYNNSKGFWMFTSDPEDIRLKKIGEDPRDTLNKLIDEKKLVSEMDMNMPFILTAQECRIVRLFFLHEYTKKQVAKIMGVTESRVAQIYKQSILKLRHFYHKHLTDF